MLHTVTYAFDTFHPLYRRDREDLEIRLYNIVMKRSGVSDDLDHQDDLDHESSDDQDDLALVLEQIIKIIPMIEISKLKRWSKPVD